MHRHYTQRLHTYYRIAHILFMLALHSFISHAPAILCSILHPPQPTPQGGRGDTINTLLIQPRPTPTHKTRGLGIARSCFRARGGPGPGYSKIMGSISTNMTCGYVTCGRQHRENSGDFGNSFWDKTTYTISFLIDRQNVSRNTMRFWGNVVWTRPYFACGVLVTVCDRTVQSRVERKVFQDVDTSQFIISRCSMLCVG